MLRYIDDYILKIIIYVYLKNIFQTYPNLVINVNNKKSSKINV